MLDCDGAYLLKEAAAWHYNFTTASGFQAMHQAKGVQDLRVTHCHTLTTINRSHKGVLMCAIEDTAANQKDLSTAMETHEVTTGAVLRFKTEHT